MYLHLYNLHQNYIWSLKRNVSHSYDIKIVFLSELNFVINYEILPHWFFSSNLVWNQSTDILDYNKLGYYLILCYNKQQLINTENWGKIKEKTVTSPYLNSVCHFVRKTYFILVWYEDLRYDSFFYPDSVNEKSGK